MRPEQKGVHFNQRQLDDLYDAQFEALVRYATYIVQDRFAAEDLAQEAFVKLMQGPPKDTDKTPAWLRIVLSRLCFDYLRGKKRGGKKEQYAQAPEQSQMQASSAEDTWLTGADVARVRGCLRELTDRDQKALLLRYSGHSYREIAQALSVEYSGVGIILLRAMKKLKAEYERKESGECDYSVLGRSHVAAVSGSGD